ncbi:MULTISPECIES: acyl-CoA dehydrogenase family protein [unclassified Streptomyces]|uniref:acyl-CoA dehydrogenase family protein n=1 Tax=unclassified Streptomyces TaxID=2593676 RepID=UPI002ED1FA59|nr:acyl-CoA dehydrogenase family protein [Streptomyces sp. BE230]WSW65601.1 acyl-CoA/acyl-ACP dehydrogenase [Streptomyces sp. NBC_00995]
MTAAESDLPEQHRSLREEVREFTRDTVIPRIKRMEASGTHADRKLPQQMAARGWAGILIPTEFGGMEAGHVAKTILLTELSYASGAAGGILQASLIPTFAIQHLGSPEQQNLWLPQIAKGLWTTIAVTEPDHGSDVLGMTATAHRNTDGSYTLNAHKTFIGNSGIARLHVVIARTGEPGSRSSRSLSAFLVEAGRRGVSVTQPPFTGMHGFTTGDLRLSNVRVPAANLLGQEGDGLAAAYGASFVCGRLNLAAVALGLHRRVLDATTTFLHGRPRKDGRLIDLPVVQHRLAHIQSGLMTAELVALHAATQLDLGEPCDPSLVNAKLTANQSAVTAAQTASDLFGGYAVRADFPLARLARDIQHIAAPAGPDDLQLLRLGESVIDGARPQWSARFARPLMSKETFNAVSLRPIREVPEDQPA